MSEYEVRSHKSHILREAGIQPYANRYERTHTISQLKELASDTSLLADGSALMASGSQPTYSIAGRMMTFRSHGKLSFATLRDGSGDIQVAFCKGLCELTAGDQRYTDITIEHDTINAYKFVEKMFDNGDFMGVKGELFVTKHGELTLFVHEYSLLSKALRPLGDKYHGVKDIEHLYRHRYIDLTMNEESYHRFQLRSDFLRVLRQFYRSEGFTEIETPILGSSASGAAAKPFVTHHNDFDAEFFLRIATEIGLKKATVGRFEKVFEIGKQFRNEGSDPSHLQEFTSVEHYAVYWNYEDNMQFTERMFDYLFEELGISRTVSVKDKLGKAQTVDFSTPWERIDYIKGVSKASGIDITKYGVADADQLRQDIKEAGHIREGIDEMGTTTLIDYLYKKVLRPHIIGPAFVFNYPATMQPLARPNDADPNIVEQFQVVVNGWEIIKAYSELVDPQLQKQNFDDQAAALAAGDEEATSGDDDFVVAMEYGMPPQSGWGMGIDRIITLITQQDNLRDSILFPLMKPQLEQGEESTNDSDTDIGSYGELPTLDQADDLMKKYLTDTYQHCRQVGHVMRYFAHKLGQPERLWYLAGLLHDIDWDHIGKDPAEHLGGKFEEIVGEIGIPELLVQDIRSHYEESTGVPVNSLIRKYLASVDELTGFVHAYSLMRPGGLEDMKAKSITKKVKDKSFAAGVNREHLKHCEIYLNIPLAEFVVDIIEALQSYEA